MSQELITRKINELNSISIEENMKLNIPVSIALQEAEDLYDWCRNDREELVRAGLDWKLVEDLPVRTATLRLSQSQWMSWYNSFRECQAEWKIASPEAYNLRDELVHHFYHAFFNLPAEYSKVQRIGKGGSHADMIQDLTDLSELGLNHTAELNDIGMDLNLLEKARAKSFELAGLLARVNGSKKETSPAREIRNKAYVHLKEAVDEIRRVGQYVFWRNKSKLNGYTSQYIRRMHSSRNKKKHPGETKTKD
jgi:hypothetical protein